nr:hypothetical protein [Desulfobacterales bacterium]
MGNLEIDSPNQVWASDITYIQLKGGFVYLTVVMEWYSRYVLSWEVSTTLDKDFCIRALGKALWPLRRISSTRTVRPYADSFTVEVGIAKHLT